MINYTPLPSQYFGRKNSHKMNFLVGGLLIAASAVMLISSFFVSKNDLSSFIYRSRAQTAVVNPTEENGLKTNIGYQVQVPITGTNINPVDKIAPTESSLPKNVISPESPARDIVTPQLPQQDQNCPTPKVEIGGYGTCHCKPPN